MLILTRKRNEKIMIGDSIEIVIVDIRGEQVQIGISAPKDVPVHRQEVYEAIVKENGKVTVKKPKHERIVTGGDDNGGSPTSEER